MDILHVLFHLPIFMYWQIAEWYIIGLYVICDIISSWIYYLYMCKWLDDKLLSRRLLQSNISGLASNET